MSKNANWYRLGIDVPHEKLVTLIQLLNAEGRNLTITELAEPVAAYMPHKNGGAPKQKTTRHVAAHGEEKPMQLAMRLLKEAPDGKLLMHNFRIALQQKGYAPTTANSVLSALAQAGSLKRLGDGVYTSV